MGGHDGCDSAGDDGDDGGVHERRLLLVPEVVSMAAAEPRTGVHTTARVLRYHRDEVVLSSRPARVHLVDDRGYTADTPAAEMVEIDEEKMQRFAGRDARLRARLREIGSWYTSKRERSLFGRGGHKHPLQVLLWAMDQADSPVRSVARKWVAFTSIETADLAPAMRESALRFPRGGPGPPCSRVGMAPIMIYEDPVEQPPQEEKIAEGMGVNLGNKLDVENPTSEMMEAGVKQVGEVAGEVFKAAHGWRLETRRILG
ncbi:hypothetical protein TRIUR3_28779 [Triticum urartu]|uniref:Uncharacterized protein n=1 Tax=Triticum urartu TaxID=4572 RepID=M7ZC92_TRIUA|nr:hypothetical protein TRIUR3_28779 [Triticum urartu]